MDFVFRKKLFELAVELSGKCLVMAQDQCRLLHFLNDIGHSERFA